MLWYEVRGLAADTHLGKELCGGPDRRLPT